ncbi:MAG TPA: hypothetical protein VLM85_15750 [Polyangiaceae bacterium]|nr:hypothetical protein [Polyangiaceae bacterium]
MLRAIGGGEGSAQGCLPVERLVEAVNRTLRREGLVAATSTSSPLDGTLSLRFTRAEQGNRWTATLSVETARGEPAGVREISRVTESCNGLDSAVVLVAALLVDSQRPIEPRPIPVDAEPAAALARPAQRRGPTFETGLGGTVTAGPLPALTGALTGWGRIAAGRWLAGEIGATWFARAGVAGSPGGIFGGGWFSAGWCPTLVASGRGALVGCARGGLGVAEGVGTGVDVPLRATLTYGLVGLAARTRVTLLGPLGLTIEAAGYVPLGGQSFFVRRGTAELDVFTAAPVFGAFTVGLEMRSL